MTETMRSYFEQVVMDLDFAMMNADATWELDQFLEEVKTEVDRRIQEHHQVEETVTTIPDEPANIEEVIVPKGKPAKR